MLGDRLVVVALAFAVLEIGGSASDVGLVFASRGVALAGCVLLGGVVADRLPRRAVMVTADLVRLASHATLGALLIAGAAPVWAVAALAGLTGAATGFFSPASTALLPAVVPPHLLPEANGLRATAMALGEVLGPALAGGLVVAAGAGWAFVVDAGTFAVSAVLLLALRLPAGRGARVAASFMADLRGGWDAFRSRSWVWSIVVSAALGNAWWGAWTVLGPVVAERDLGGAGAWGAIVAAMGAGGLAGSVLAIRARPRRPLVVVALSGAAFATPLALLAGTASVPLVALGAFVAGGGLMLGGAVWESALQRRIPEESLARVSAYDWFGSLAVYPIGLVVWGPAAALLGVRPALWLAFALLLATTLAPLAVPAVRRLGSESEPN